MPADMNDYFKKRKPSSGGEEENSGGSFDLGNHIGGGKGAGTLIVIAIVLIALFLFKPFIVINSGEVGIKVRMGKFEETPLSPGLHFYIPVIEKIFPVNTRIRLITYSDSRRNAIGESYNRYEGGLRRNPAIGVMDKRGLRVSIDLAVQYRLRPEVVPKTIAKWGGIWEEKIINSKVREVVRDVIGQYPAEQLPEMRNEIANQIETKIKDAINSLKDRPVILSSVELRNIDLPPKIKDQIERVQIAKQEVTIAEQMKEKAKQDALRKAEIARGEAEKKRIEAQGEADRIRIEADSQAKANILISKSLTDRLLKLEQIKTQKEFNEALKTNRDAQIFLTPGGAVPNIWIDAKDKKKTTSIGE